jgi:hypothetical protein
MTNEPLVNLKLTYTEISLIREALFQHGYRLSVSPNEKLKTDAELMERLRQKIMSVWMNSVNGERT